MPKNILKFTYFITIQHNFMLLSLYSHPTQYPHKPLRFPQRSIAMCDLKEPYGCCSRSKSNSMPGVGLKGIDGGNQQSHQQRHRFQDGSGDVGIKASGNRSRQERESGKGSYRDTSVHEIRIPQPVHIVWP